MGDGVLSSQKHSLYRCLHLVTFHFQSAKSPTVLLNSNTELKSNLRDAFENVDPEYLCHINS